MTQEQLEIYTQVKARLRRIGKENPADAILYLELEVRAYRHTIEKLKEELERYQVINKLLESDIADRDKMLEQKVEEVYPEFMRDYKCMREELDGVYEELAELRKERDAMMETLKKKTDGYRTSCTIIDEEVKV